MLRVMASSSKVRQKAPSHSGGSRPARRARSTIHSLAEGDSRYTQSKRRSDSRTDSNAAAAYNVSMRRKSRGTRENDDDATPEADQDHGNDHRSNRSQRKRQKAQLRTQSPDEDLCRSSSSDYSSSSDSVQVIMTTRVCLRNAMPVSLEEQLTRLYTASASICGHGTKHPLAFVASQARSCCRDG